MSFLVTLQNASAASLVQVASVVGPSFTAMLLTAVHPVAREAGDLRSDLAALAESGFIRRDDGAADAWSWCQVGARSCTGTCIIASGCSLKCPSPGGGNALSLI